MDITGEIKMLNDTVQVSDKFKKREFVVVDKSSQYPQSILFQATQDKCDLLNNFKVGDTISVYFNIRGREWTNPQGEVKYFNSLDAWKIMSAATTIDHTQQPAADPNEFSVSDHDDLPF